MDPVRHLLSKYTPEQLAKLLWQTIKENTQLRDDVHRLKYENYWATNPNKSRNHASQD
jgi:hypothetical protein